MHLILTPRKVILIRPAEIEIEQSTVPVCAAESVTRTVNGKMPARVGVPEIVPSAASDRPGGKAPAEIENV